MSLAWICNYKTEEVYAMLLERKQILPVGCVVTLLFEADQGKETFALIVGHLSLHSILRYHYDYVCIYLPEGFERGTFYVNHEDICRVYVNADEYGCLHEKWMRRKYGEYQAYYAHYDPDSRLSLDEMRRQMLKAEECHRVAKCYRTIIRWALSAIILLSVGAIAWHTKSVLPVPIALFSVLLGFLLHR